MIEIGDNVTISSYVVFITHDNSIQRVSPKTINLFGKIVVGDNCFLGERSTLMYGVKLANNVIVASGSVVTNSFATERIIIGGNPARVIGSWDKFFEKTSHLARGRRNIKKVLEEHPELLVERKIKG
ncbi:MAG: acyltransferase [Thermoguttaceae bacterium]|nr:acyltransferase [Thermoguttaceae bacterium]